MIKLSIITINFNNVYGLDKTIESVIYQTSIDFEYIIIDGGSTDGSVEVIREYENRINFWVSEPDRGIYHAMNKGIAQAQGEYCQFLNSGDWLVSTDTTARMIKNLDGSSVTYGNLIKHWADGRTYWNKATDANSLFTYYNGTLNHASAYIKRSLFNTYGIYDESLKIVADWKFYLMAIGMNGESVQYIDVDVANFDMSGISSQQTTLEKTERRRVMEEVLPANLLADYDRNSISLQQLRRIEHYPWAQKVVWLLDRFLFQWEKRWKS